jgi:ATP-dependent Clp protease ATP-binding subunit ClpA
MDERKQQFLEYVILDYIDTAQPVSSSSIQKKYQLPYSSATIRNELAELEVESNAIAYLAEKGYSPDFGARELERTVSSILETYLANYLLINNIRRGDHIIITRDNIIK